jgi:hypothetical protein
MYKLRDWIESHKDELDWNRLSTDPKAMRLLQENPDKIRYKYLCANTHPEAIRLIEKEIKLDEAPTDEHDEADNEWKQLKLWADRLQMVEMGRINATTNPPLKTNHLDWTVLSSNPSAIKLIERKLANEEKEKRPQDITSNVIISDVISWAALSSNPAAFHILEKNMDKINWSELSSNTCPEAIQLLENNIDKIDWNKLMSNHAAIDLMEKHSDKITPENLGRLFAGSASNKIAPPVVNPSMSNELQRIMRVVMNALPSNDSDQNDTAMTIMNICFNVADYSDEYIRDYIAKHVEDLDHMSKIVFWAVMLGNSKNINIIKQYLDEEDEKNNEYGNDEIWLAMTDHIRETWSGACGNQHMIDLLEQNQDRVDWTTLSRNPAIFTYDYEKMKENCLRFKEELMKERFHPSNLAKFREWGIDGFDSDSDSDSD